MRKSQDEHQSLKDVLKDFVSENKLQKGLDKVAVQEVWVQTMGPAITKYTHALKLERDTLYVQLTSSVLRQELNYGKEKIISNLNQALGKELIKKLILK